MEPSRRTFLQAALFGVNAAIGALAGIPVLGYVLGPLFRPRPTQWVDAGAPGEYSAEPKRKKLQYVRSTGFREEQKSQNVWIHAEGPELVVYSSECPHVGCNVTWKHEAGKAGIFFCPCHGGEFDLAGKVLAGPPPSDLKRLPSKVENGKLLVQV